MTAVDVIARQGAPASGRRSPSCWARAWAASPRRSRPIATIPYGELPGFPADRGRQPRRAARAGPCRSDAGRRAAGPRALLRAWPRRRDEAAPSAPWRSWAARRCCRPTRPAACGSTCRPARRWRSPTTSISPASIRCSARPADRPLRRHGRCLRSRRCRADAVGGRGPPGSSATKASISGSAARASRRRPRSAPPACWAPMRSACRPCRRRSWRGMPA